MADITPRMSAKEYLSNATIAKLLPAGGIGRKNKFGNRKVITEGGECYDSVKELRHHGALRLAMSASDAAERVVGIDRQVSYLLVAPQDGERAVKYVADFVVHFADGRSEVHDTKSPPTRANRAYVIKRKLMLSVHGLRIKEL